MKSWQKGDVFLVENQFHSVRETSAFLIHEGYRVSEFQDPRAALSVIPESVPDLVISSLELPGMDGMQLLRQLKIRHPGIPLILMSAFGTVETAVDAMASGAFHFFSKPLDYVRLKEVVDTAISRKSSVPRWEKIEKPAGDKYTILATSPCMLKVVQVLEEVKDSSICVLITGETGTGKELVARMLHHKSFRDNKPFVAVNCAAIPSGLIEAELFGSEKGSYTGAVSRRIGKFEEASGGTLLLDEIGDLPLPLQAKLLRVLQEKEIERIGNNKRMKVDFRLLSSTNRNLKKLVESGAFHEDLYYRINVVNIELPPLRERVEDFLVLADKFVREFSAREKKQVTLSNEVIGMLQAYHWPGNVRQLRNAIERAVVLTKGRKITSKDFPPDFQTNRRGVDYHLSMKLKQTELRELGREAVIKSLMVCNGNKSKAARLLGISRKALYGRLEAYGISSNGSVDQTASDCPKTNQ